MSDRGTELMSFGEAIQTCFRKYAEFMGRAARDEFWWWALFNVLVTGALNLFNVIRIGDNAYLGSLLAGVWGVAVLLPYFAVAVRRLREDRQHPGRELRRHFGDQFGFAAAQHCGQPIGVVAG